MLTVLYDDGCAFCVRCREVLHGHEQVVRLRFVPMSSPLARDLTQGSIPGDGTELVVVAEDGAYWVGADAFLVCLWALEDMRALSLAMANPWLRPAARWFFRTLSSHRHVLSRWMGAEPCGAGHCGVAPARHVYR